MGIEHTPKNNKESIPEGEPNHSSSISRRKLLGMMGATATVSLSGNAGASDIESHAPEPKNISNNTEREQQQEALAQFHAFIQDIHATGGFANPENLPRLTQAFFGPDVPFVDAYIAERAILTFQSEHSNIQGIWQNTLIWQNVERSREQLQTIRE